jgi:hypothetical protein
MKSGLLLMLQAVLFAGLVSYAGSEGEAVPFTPAPQAPDHWSFSYPTDGTIAYESVVHLGSGPTNRFGSVFMYYYNNTVSGGVYASELSLETVVNVDTYTSETWATPENNNFGEWYSVVLGDDVLGDGNPIDSAEAETDVDSLVTGMGGDGVAFFITTGE